MRFTVFIIVALTIASLVVLFIDNATINPFLLDYAFGGSSEDITERPYSFESNVQTLQNTDSPSSHNASNFVVEPTHDYSNLIFDNCELPHLNPWDPSITKYLKPGTKKKTCKSTFKPLTKLEDRLLFKIINDSETTCSYRCLHAVNDYMLNYGGWQNITDSGATPTCDIVETKCYKNGSSSNKPFYEFMHAQIYRNDTSESKEKPESPDVHIIVIDSVSHSQFVRALPRTYHELIANYEAIQFPHLNKIAVNSRPNALAMFLGKSQRNIAKSPMSVGYSSDFKKGADCNKPLDDDQFVGKFFKDAGYKTLVSDDWAIGTFNWPNCKGFSRKAADHIMKPFQLRSRVGKKFYNKKISNGVYGGMCKESFETIMDYLDKFIAAYPDKPKFSITWSIDIAHNDNNQLYHADAYYHSFFRRNEKKLNNSFVFVMGDHGLRFSGLRNTRIGETEDNNPFLMVSLPWSLRRNAEIASIVRENALQLITHYDLYATFVDIAQSEKKNNSTKLIMHGSSLLRPLPQPRTCDRLRVPFEYCMCIRSKTKLPSDNSVGEPAALKMVDLMNQVIKTEPSIKNICTPLLLNPNATITVEKFKSEGKLNVYQVTYNVLPGGGRFWGYVGQEGNNSDIRVISARFPRLNSYEKTAFCAKSSSYTAYCYCKSLIKS